MNLAARTPVVEPTFKRDFLADVAAQIFDINPFHNNRSASLRSAHFARVHLLRLSIARCVHVSLADGQRGWYTGTYEKCMGSILLTATARWTTLIDRGEKGAESTFSCWIRPKTLLVRQPQWTITIPGIER